MQNWGECRVNFSALSQYIACCCWEFKYDNRVKFQVLRRSTFTKLRKAWTQKLFIAGHNDEHKPDYKCTVPVPRTWFANHHTPEANLLKVSSVNKDRTKVGLTWKSLSMISPKPWSYSISPTLQKVFKKNQKWNKTFLCDNPNLLIVFLFFLLKGWLTCWPRGHFANRRNPFRWTTSFSIPHEKYNWQTNWLNISTHFLVLDQPLQKHFLSLNEYGRVLRSHLCWCQHKRMWIKLHCSIHYWLLQIRKVGQYVITHV